ncbi:unnamed protein product [Brachionus calyciflorus]|uniref:Senescence domain-containing protein n=1 Tax=Brachionus calyciflorus TaxID=104777 RepID=A0A813ZKW9_9BILA|nr:unnamed protein product [Brachionus calyciflorus]
MSDLLKPSNQQALVDKLANLKKEAFSNLDQALTMDSNESSSNPQRNHVDQIIIMYEKCLNLIDQAVEFYEQNKSNLKHNETATTQHSHLISIRNQTLERLNKLKTDRMNNQNRNSEFLSLSDEILNSNDYLIIDELPQVDTTISQIPQNDFTKATEILHLNDGVQLFYIANDGTVSTPSYPTNLSIYTFNDSEKMSGFIRVGDWMYPLITNESSPGMKTNFNAYIFPNNDEQESKFSFVGITFSDGVSSEDKRFFEDILSNMSSLIYQDSTSEAGIKRPVIQPSEIIAETSEQNDENIPRSWSAEKIAQSIINGAQYISNGVATGSEYASKYIKTGGDKLKSNLEPVKEPVEVDPKVKKVAQNVRYGTHVTVRVSSYLLNKLSSIASSTAKTVAPHLKNGSTALLSKTFANNKSQASSYVENVCTVAHGSVKGLGIVYDSLEQAAKALGKNVTEQTVTVVDHKYGPEAAKVTENGLFSVGNVALTYNNFRNLKVVRTLAKETAKEAISNSSKISSNTVDQTTSTLNNQEKNEKNFQ